MLHVFALLHVVITRVCVAPAATGRPAHPIGRRCFDCQFYPNFVLWRPSVFVVSWRRRGPQLPTAGWCCPSTFTSIKLTPKMCSLKLLLRYMGDLRTCAAVGRKYLSWSLEMRHWTAHTISFVVATRQVQYNCGRKLVRVIKSIDQKCIQFQYAMQEIYHDFFKRSFRVNSCHHKTLKRQRKWFRCVQLHTHNLSFPLKF